MHAWLPEAYGQAPAPAAALLSTALLATALGALLRVHAITAACVGAAWPEGLLAVFGVLSLVVAVPFLVVQGEFKRLLAWSSLEHTGLVTLAVGLGTPLAGFAAMLHLFVQSLAKALAFLLAGTLIRASGSTRMDHWSGVFAAHPGIGVLLAGAGLGLAGLPPAGTFLTEWLAITGGLAGPRPGFAVAGLVALVAAFMGLAFHWTHMLLGRPRRDLASPLPADAHRPLALLLALLVLFGVWLPGPVRTLATEAARVLRP
jgi:hydrogenase-4 component F